MPTSSAPGGSASPDSQTRPPALEPVALAVQTAGVRRDAVIVEGEDEDEEEGDG